MSKRLTSFVTDARFVRRARERDTIEAMVRMYCRGHKHAGDAPLCPNCARLLAYATRRLIRCVFGDAKPTCADCTVHCYRADMREEIRVVMRWAGPRMLLRHPVLAVFHLIAEWRPAPTLPARAAPRGDGARD